MVRPRTNCLPISFIAWFIAARITGSPERCTSLPMTLDGRASVRLSRVTTLPVITRPQAAKLTSTLSLWPRWRCQSAADSLSRISASAVAASGTRSRASARHISIRPSWVSRLY
ncbi:hypothetical protein D3C78_1267280 [compost metagenome]